ncbi:BrnT family toxin [Methylobacterium sp. E-005]|uniref:BrnT family toxin n=1 Tax=Methylobacterium sp. E-005 TaxID=2836549 RepID=UPI001FBB5C53|nr:BrnT family toxin [Methylobacterium sp. E-005]MCJ2090614.1 BrnT family toxin [Methylobacterium sp. E-005]
MRITYDAEKRARTLRERGLDFERCAEIFDGTEVTGQDTRGDYGETRWITVGYLDDRLVVTVWTERDGDRRIISLRKANEREQARFGARLRSAQLPR